MVDKEANAVHWSFWVIGVVGLTWNVLGGVNFFMQMDTDLVAILPDTHRAIIIDRPAWATAGFAVIVFGGSLGCLLLLLRKRPAYYLFIASLLGGCVTMIHTVRVAGSALQFSPIEILVMIISPLLVAGLLLGYSKWAIRKNWVG